MITRWLAAAIAFVLVGDVLVSRTASNKPRPVALSTAVDRFRRSARDPGAPIVAATVTAPSSAPPPTAGATAARSSAGRAPTGASGPGALRTPTPGVYRYRTVGREDTNAVGGAGHRYPDTTTVTITAAPCGFTMRWDGLEQRWDSWTVCVTNRELYVTSETFKHAFFGVSDQRTYACTRAQLRPGPEAPGTRVGGRCAGAGDTAVWTGQVVGVEQLRIEGVSVPALHTRIVEHLSGNTDGDRSWDDWWSIDAGLLLRRRWTVVGDSSTVFGGAHYTESVALDLLSETPTR
jgi:hypothetical protein